MIQLPKPHIYSPAGRRMMPRAHPRPDEYIPGRQSQGGLPSDPTHPRRRPSLPQLSIQENQP